MLNFPHHRHKKSKDGASYIKDVDIENYAEQVLADFNSTLLETPQAIDWLRFLEFYLGRNINFASITPHADGEDILGACSFDDLVPLSIYNAEFERNEILELNTGDIALHTLLEKQPQRLLFTALHEGGHWAMHQPYYFAKNQAKGQLSFFGDTQKVIKCCRKSDIEPSKSKKSLATTEDHLEHQANVFAAAIAVPRKAVLKIIPELFKKHGYELRKLQNKDNILTPDNFTEELLDRLITEGLIENDIASIFGVSKQVAKIRLEQLNVWYDKTEIEKIIDQQHNVNWSSFNEVSD